MTTITTLNGKKCEIDTTTKLTLNYDHIDLHDNEIDGKEIVVKI